MVNIKIPNAVKKLLPFRLASAVYYSGKAELASSRSFSRDRSRISSYLTAVNRPRLQIGAGSNLLDGWLNTDYFPDGADLIHLDATRRFPFPDSSFDLIFSEHVIEHVPLVGGVSMIAEAFRVLRPGGRLRLSTPPLEFLLDGYRNPESGLNGTYRAWHFEIYNPDSPSKAPVVLFNDYVRMWGHVFIYDAALLSSLMVEAGFVEVQRCAIGESDEPLLVGLENEGRMPDGLLRLSTMSIEGKKPI